MGDWITIFALLKEGRPPEKLVAAIFSSGVEKPVAFDLCVPATTNEAHELCRLIERYVDFRDSPFFDATDDYIDAKWSPLVACGWHAAKLPKELSVGDEVSLHERRLRQAIQLGFNPSTGRANPGTTVEKIAKQMGMSRQALEKSLKKALEERAVKRRAGSIALP